MYQPLFAALTPQSVVLTPSRRLAKHLLAAYADFKQQQGQYAWSMPRIIALADWLEELWQLLTQLPDDILPGKRLSESQELLIWEQVVKESPIGELLLRPLEAAKSAMQTWHAIYEWQIPLSQVQVTATIDTQALIEFATAVKEICDKNQWLTRSDVIMLRISHSDHIPTLYLPESVFFYGFESLTPAVTALIENLAKTGIKISHMQPIATKESHCARYAFNDEIEEWQTVARWAKQLVVEGKKNIGIIIPHLNDVWSAVEQVFTNTLLPESLFNSQLIAKRPFNISGGQSLAKMPIVASALQIIQFFCEPLAIEDVAAFLSLPFLGGSVAEESARVQLVEMLFEQRYLTISWYELAKYCQQHDLCPLLQRQLTLTQSIWQPIAKKTQTASEWVQLFQTVLTAMGWPGERVISSAEYQARDHFFKVSQQFVAVEEVRSQLTARYALLLLQRALNNVVFQIQTENKPIQILGALEAVGLTFDHLWIVGLTDKIWPGIPSPYPFIPLLLQHQYQLPHTSSEWELSFTKCLTERFLQAAPLVNVSSAITADGEEQGVSRLIQQIPLADISTLSLYQQQDFQQQVKACAQIEAYDDEFVPLSLQGEKVPVKGGAYVLKLQAVCPFRAFAEIRLDAISQSPAQWGLGYRERGILLHKSLEILWKQLKSAEYLNSLTNDELIKNIENSIQQAIVKLKNSALKNANDFLLQNEQQRLMKQISQLMRLEKQREPFTVEACEESLLVTVGQLQLQLRVDRIDKLTDNEYVVIDYKSGSVSAVDWLDEQLAEPQLPLYAVNLNKKIAAIVFAQVQAEQVAFKGIAREDKLLPGVKSVHKIPIEDWATLQTHWRNVLQSIADQFYHGDVSVMPKNGALTCRTCQLQSLCRING